MKIFKKKFIKQNSKIHKNLYQFIFCSLRTFSYKNISSFLFPVFGWSTSFVYAFWSKPWNISDISIDSIAL